MEPPLNRDVSPSLLTIHANITIFTSVGHLCLALFALFFFLGYVYLQVPFFFSLFHSLFRRRARQDYWLNFLLRGCFDLCQLNLLDREYVVYM